jgi:histidine triad (HIT) family protein
MSNNCLFCKIVAGELGGSLVYQDNDITAFKDINPQAPVHILVVPNRHIDSVGHASEADHALLGRILLVAAEVAKKQGVSDGGYRLVINKGDNGGQTVSHLHVHLLGARRMTWPPG